MFFHWNVFELVFIYFSETVLALMLSFVKIFYLKITFSSMIVNVLIYVFIFSSFVAVVGVILFLFYFANLEKVYPDAGFADVLKKIFSPAYFIGLALFIIVDVYYLIRNYIKK